MSTFASRHDEVEEALLGITNTVSDLLRADFNTYQRTIPKLSRFLHTPPLGEISTSLKSKVDLDLWIATGTATQSSMMGSARLPPSASIEEELGLVIALIECIADGTFPKGKVSSVFEDVRRVPEREKLLR
jgi:hypothetical protein